jgi:hypothetical protein
MATVHDVYTNEEQRSVVRFLCGQKNSMQRIFIKKYFLSTVGCVCRLKRFHFGDKRFADSQKVETEVQKWLRKQSKDFSATGFNALEKRWNKCIEVGGGCVPGSSITYFTFYIPL